MTSIKTLLNQLTQSISLIIFLILFSFFLVSCSNQQAREIILAPAKLMLPDEYQRTVTQGRELEKEKLDLIQIGSSKKDVLLFLGEPVVQDLFNPNKWIYLYKEKSELKGLIEYRLELEFENDRVSDLVRKGI